MSFREVIENKKPDVCAVLEVRSSFERMARLQGFERWLQEQKYFWYFLTWTQDGDQKRIGEAGVAVFCRVKPLAVEFGVAIRRRT